MTATRFSAVQVRVDSDRQRLAGVLIYDVAQPEPALGDVSSNIESIAYT
jgi:hypothetical protein